MILNLYFQQEIVNANLENAKLQSLISDVQDLLPHLGVGFIQVSCIIMSKYTKRKTIFLEFHHLKLKKNYLTSGRFNNEILLEKIIIGVLN